jgi:hypothetical protein
MIQQIGRLIQLLITTITLSSHHHCLLALANAAADCGMRYRRSW